MSRDREDEVFHELLARLTDDERLSLLALLRGMTALADGAVSPAAPGAGQDKAWACWRVLRLAGDFARCASRRAAYQLVGMIVNGVEPWAFQRSIMGRRSPAVDQVDPNAPEHEQRGTETQQAPPEVERKLIVHFLRLGAPLPDWMAKRLEESLTDLEHERVDPLFKPRRRGVREQDPARMEELRHKALLHVTYHHGRWGSLTDAKDKVAKAYGVQSETLVQWRKRLGKYHGKQTIEASINVCFDRGRVVRKWPKREQSDIEWTLCLGDEDLVKDGREFQRKSFYGRKGYS